MGGYAILALAWIAAVTGPLYAAVAFRRSRRSRSGLVAWGVMTALAALPWSLGVWACLIEPETLAVRHVTVESPDWSGAPLRIGLISDTHAGAPHGSPARIRGIVRRMNREHPDLVLLLGDYVGRREAARAKSPSSRSSIMEGVRALAGLRAPLGVMAVLGNHDIAYGREAIAATLRTGGATVLLNRTARIDRPGGAFQVAGMNSVTDVAERPWTWEPFAGPGVKEPVILAMHEPDMFARQLPAALTVAGHTHCKQVNIPYVRPPVRTSAAADRWSCHLYRLGSHILYVTGGTGTSILPVRFRAPPEIVILTLKSPALRTDYTRDIKRPPGQSGLAPARSSE